VVTYPGVDAAHQFQDFRVVGVVERECLQRLNCCLVASAIGELLRSCDFLSPFFCRIAATCQSDQCQYQEDEEGTFESCVKHS